jgi:hypothetical protein
MKKLMFCLLVMLMLHHPVVAQETVCEAACSVRVGQSFVAFTEHDSTAWDFKLVINGQVSTLVPRFVNGYVEFAHPGFTTTGNFTLVITAQSQAGPVQYTDNFAVSSTRRKIKIRQ